MTNGITPRANDDLAVLIESVEEADKLFDGKMVEPIIRQRRDLWLRDAKDCRRVDLLEATLFTIALTAIASRVLV